MPERLVREHAAALPAHQAREPDDAAGALAGQFGVSTLAMSFRLINLGLAS